VLATYLFSRTVPEIVKEKNKPDPWQEHVSAEDLGNFLYTTSLFYVYYLIVTLYQRPGN
jgi:hypothetical protein